jgi:Cu-Zn family superoxide dismutase
MRSLLIFAMLLVAHAYGDGGPQAPVSQAIAVIKPSSGSSVKGVVVFTKVQGGVQVVADVDGLKPGLHGFHIHEKGDCSAADASSAGGHFNPANEVHAGPDALHRHIGDLGNIEADAEGHGHYDRIDKLISLEGPNSIIGKSVIVHEKEDDFKTQPTGNAGGRLGCGLIQAK